MSSWALHWPGDRRGGAGDGSVRAGVVLAAAGHILLLVLLSLATGPQRPRVWPEPTPLEVSLVTEVTPEARAPADPTPPAPSVAPETGAPEEAAPPPAPTPEPAKPAPPEPTPVTPAPARPAPAKPTPPRPAAVKPAPAPKPAPVKPAPAPKPASVKPAPAKPAAAAKPAAKPQPTTARAAPGRSAPPRTSRLAGIVPSMAAGTSPAATTTRPRGRRLGDDFLAGLSADAPARRPSPAAAAAKIGPYPTASIVQAIARQIQPCADRQVNPGPGANRILTTLNIRLNQDGSLAATPSKVKQSGVDGENDRYAQRVVDLGIAAFKGCSPLKLPGEYYRTENGGWGNINYQWKLR